MAVKGMSAENLNRFDRDSHHVETRRCRRCGVRKALWAFYRERTCRGGRRPECKMCHRAWRRAHYRPRSGRRNVTKSDRAAQTVADMKRTYVSSGETRAF